MKGNALKKLTVILLILLVSLISFAGIYAKQLNKIINIVPDYKVGMDFGTIRAIRLDVSTASETKYYDADGNEVDSAEGENITTKEIPVNPEEVLTEENFAKAKNIMIERLDTLGANEYQIRQDENGYFAIEFPESNSVDKYVETIYSQGKFEIKDSESNEVLMNNSNIEEVYATTYSNDSVNAQVYLIIDFNEEGKQKLEEISKEYVQTTDEEGKTTTKKVSLEIDGQSMMNTYFGETMSTGQLQIPIGDKSSNVETINSYLAEGQVVTTILNTGVIPIKYELTYSNTLSSTLRDSIMYIALFAMVIIVAILIAYIIIRYNAKGILGGLSFIGFIALYLLIMRYTNSLFTVNSVISIIVVCITDYIFLLKVCGRKETGTFNEKMIRYAILCIPMCIIGIVFSFSAMVTTSSFGIALFWGTVTLMAYNYVVTKSLIEDK